MQRATRQRILEAEEDFRGAETSEYIHSARKAQRIVRVQILGVSQATKCINWGAKLTPSRKKDSAERARIRWALRVKNKTANAVGKTSPYIAPEEMRARNSPDCNVK
jgi:hypothetical protein